MYAGITLTGAVNTAYAVQATMNLSDPNGWTTLTNVVLSSSPFIFIDYNSPETIQRYYLQGMGKGVALFGSSKPLLDDAGLFRVFSGRPRG